MTYRKKQKTSYPASIPAYSETPVSYTTMLVWGEEGPKTIAVPVRKFQKGRDHVIRDLMLETLNLPYSGDDPRMMGLSKGEAMVISITDRASYGDLEAVGVVLDRLLGKPQQTINTLNVKATLEEYLDSLAAKQNLEMPVAIEGNPPVESDPAESL